MGQTNGREEEPKLSSEEKKKYKAARVHIVKEILETEETYVEGLNIVVEVWMQPLLDAIEKNSPIVKQSAITTIFSNLPDLLILHEKILANLRQRVNAWDNKTMLSDVFAANVGALKMYTTYVNNYDKSLTALQKASGGRRWPKYYEICKNNPRCKKQDLAGLLITPVQRLPRYRLLLESLIKKTGGLKHKDYYPLIAALEEIKKVNTYVNDQKRVAENMQRVMEIQLATSAVDLFVKGRLVISEHSVSRNGNSINCYLFTDYLLLAEKKLLKISKQSQLVIWAGFLEDVKATDGKNNKAVNLKAKSKVLTIEFETSEVKDKWLGQFHVARSKSFGAKKMFEAMKKKQLLEKENSLRSLPDSKHSKKPNNKKPTKVSTPPKKKTQDPKASNKPKKKEVKKKQAPPPTKSTRSKSQPKKEEKKPLIPKKKNDTRKSNSKDKQKKSSKKKKDKGGCCFG